ncbi:MAG: TolC family protein [Bacteroidetes bacterium]|nr:TolC family protein [Bacteroidota bacterium]
MTLVRKTHPLTGMLMLLGLLSGGNIHGQEIKSFSLKEAQDYAVQNSYASRNAALDLKIAHEKVWETTAIGLPQINGSIQYQDMLDVPTTLLPDFITPAVVGVNEHLFGLNPTTDIPANQYFAAKFGTQHNLSIGGTLSQLIFNGQYIVGLQAVKTFYKMTNQSKDKSDIETRQTVANTYYLLVVTTENRKILQEGVSIMERTLFETQEMFKNGFVEDMNVDQMQLNLTNLKNAISALDRQIEVVDKLLKFQMGLDVNSTIIARDSLKGLLSQMKLDPILQTGLNLNNHIDYKMMETQEKLQWLNYKREQSNYLPVVSGFFTYQQKAMRDKFNFTEGGSTGLWYPTTIIGVQMDVPIFSSFMKHAKVQQARLSLDKAKLAKEQVAQGLVLDAEQSRTSFNTALDKFNKETDNLKLAENIYQKTNKKFKEGLSTSLDLTQAYNQYLTTQSNYFSAIFDLLNARNKYDKAINNY